MAPPATAPASPRRIAQVRAGLSKRWRNARTVSSSSTIHNKVMAAPIVPNSPASSAVALLKWLGTPRAACTVMMTSSSAATPAITVPPSRTRRPGICAMIQARAGAMSAIDVANLAGFNQAGAPRICRPSTASRTSDAASKPSAPKVTSASGRWSAASRPAQRAPGRRARRRPRRNAAGRAVRTSESAPAPARSIHDDRPRARASRKIQRPARRSSARKCAQAIIAPSGVPRRPARTGSWGRASAGSSTPSRGSTSAA